ncbi:asparagine synthetase B family protein [Sphingomonas arenae]|uniref:asparagine synthetase B family protein n=1 Tax=Sphingomonas arenae TaxID=2812555 RepID=UPI0019689763|nr:asparagine synthase-related protein [Sphingomonas arenae]
MTPIAGYWRRSGDVEPARACATILQAHQRVGQDAPQLASAADVAFGCLSGSVPSQDARRPQVLRASFEGLLVFDGRIDNRDEVVDRLGLDLPLGSTLGDCGLVVRAWRRWGISCLDHLLGDYALAAWEGDVRRLCLARSPLSMRSLFFCSDARAVGFASSIRGLLAAKGPRQLDDEALVAILAGGTYVGTAGSLFKGIRSVPQGHAVLIGDSTEGVVPLWSPPTEPRQFRSVQECAEAFRTELDRAVGAQLRRERGAVAAHLSGGRDSGVVAATAARLLREQGEEVLAYTGAPSEGLAERAPSGLPIDESELASATATLHPNLRHKICRSQGDDPLALLERLQEAQVAPLLTPSNLPWWAAINAQAARDGVTVLLTGQVGNFSVSAGGPSAVRDLAHEREWRAFAAAGVRFVRERGVRNAGTRLLGPLVPGWLYDGLRSWVRGGTEIEVSLPLLREPWRARAEGLRRARMADHRPPANYRAFLRESLLQIDNAERISGAVYGLDVRDPTADRRLVELVLSFPAKALFGEEDRPAFSLAFSDRLPQAVIQNRDRAYQQADWFEQFRPDQVLGAFRRYSANPIVAELIDMQVVEKMVEDWPRGTGWMTDPKRFARVEDEYRNKLLPTLAVAAFLAAEFPG